VISRRGARAPVSVAAVLVAATLAACSSGPGSPSTAQPATSGAAATTASSSPSQTTGIPADASPLSGRAGGAGKPVLVVKFDNTTFAQPQTGLRSADIVYVEEVEFGLTRLAAVFSSAQPRTVGPIRSARISDIDLLAQFGRPAFAYSGSQHKLRPLLAKASLYDVSGDKGPSGYFRDHSRRAPYDFFGHPRQLLARAPHASGARDIGFVFAVTTPSGGRPVKTAVAPYPASQAAFVWDAKAHAFDVLLNKRPARATEGGVQHATTVVLQYVAQSDSGFHDKYGGHTPLLKTVGTGKAWVLRDGRAWPVTWSRPVATAGTTFTGADGARIAFAPGQVWIALVNSRSKVALH
jgi:Protein of unknown function (DUF3048) N-terminal domain/Protein of unknown function (DUF3048) C-terminal domain